MKPRSFIFGTIAAVVALNYFAFRVELFGDEYRENHPPLSSSQSLTVSSLNWETFDKDNAPPAITIRPDHCVTLLLYLEPPSKENVAASRIVCIVRDKSPPVS